MMTFKEHCSLIRIRNEKLQVASNYQRGLHKAAQAAAVENDGTRNVWDLFEGLWQCASHARIGKVLPFSFMSYETH